MPRTQTAALNVARSYIGKPWQRLYCQLWVRTVFGVPSAGDVTRDGRASAWDAWVAARLKVETGIPSELPAGVPVYFSGGKDGHVAISTGGGGLISTDIPAGRVGYTSVAYIERNWGRRLVGYALVDGYGNDYRDPAGAPAPSAPKERLDPMLYITGKNYVVLGHNGGFVEVAHTPDDPRSEYVNLVKKLGEPVWVNAATLNNLIEDARGNANSALLAEVQKLVQAEADEVAALKAADK